MPWLEKVIADASVPARQAQAYAILAMAQHRAGQAETAVQTLQEGMNLAQRDLARNNRIDWNDELIARLLLAEAKGVIGLKTGAEPRVIK